MRIERTFARSTAWGLAAAVAAAVFACGCGTARSFGRRTDVGALESSFKMRVSTKADVLAALGHPRNTGGVMFPGQDGPREVWFYYAEESTEAEAKRQMVFVFFRDDVYDGYMWVSSLPVARQQ